MLIHSFEFPLPDNLEVKKILQLACDWIIGSKHYTLSKDDFNGLLDKTDEIIEKGNEKVEFGYANFPNISSSIGGIRFSKQDKDNTTWVTTIVSSKNHNQHFISIQLSCELSQASLQIPNAKKPYIIKQILKEYSGGMDGQIPVSDKAILLKEGEEEIAAALIQDVAENILPIVYISYDPELNQHLIDYKKIAKNLSGNAHVIVEPSRKFSMKLRSLSNAKNVFNGTIGVYWPQNGRKSYFLTDSIDTPNKLERNIQEDIIQALLNKRQTTQCNWLYLKECISKQRIDQLRKNSTDVNVEEYINAFDDELRIKEERLEEANKEIAKLEAENRRLNSTNFSRSQGVLNYGNEQDLYDYEIRSFVVDALKYTLENNTKENSRKYHILYDLFNHNKLDEKKDLRIIKQDRLKRIMNDYQKMTPKTLEELKNLGFDHSDEGKHHKFVFSNDGRYTATISKTSSDYRAGKNFSRDVANQIFK